MNASMGTQPAGSNGSNVNPSTGTTNNISNSATSLSLENHGGMTVLAGQQAQYSNFPQSPMGYSHLNLYDKVGLVQPMGKEAGGMYDHHNSLYGNVHTSSLLTSDHSVSPPPPPRVYKPCVVCNDKSSGYHYGVSSCEGCKGFFRRSVQKNMQYTCHKDKNCVINKVTRNRCQYCRLQKCYLMGMSKEAVRNDRNKKRKQKPESTSNLSEELTEDDQMLLQEILDAHRDTTPSTHNGATTLTPSVADSRSGTTVAASTTTSSLSASATESKSDEETAGSSGVFLWEKITELSSAGIVMIVDFAKKIPGFLSLSTSDQITLLKAACLEIMILRISICYDLSTDTMQFSNGLSLTQEQLQKGGFGPLTSAIFSFAASLKRMNCDETEYAMLSSICLISGDRSGLHNTEKIEQMQEPLLEALKHYIRSRRPDQKHIFAKMLMKLTDLRSISVKGEKQMSPYALDCLRDLLAQPLSPPQTSVTCRDRLPVSKGGHLETGATATVRPNHDFRVSLSGSNVTVSTSVSTMSSASSGGYYSSSTNTMGSGSYNNANSVSSTGTGGAHPLMPGRGYSNSSMLGPDLESVVPTDFVSGSTPSLAQSQSGSSNIVINTSEGLSPLSAYGNNFVNKQSTFYVNRWETKQQQQLGVKDVSTSLGALEVIVKPVKQTFMELAGSSNSLNRSPSSETPSSGPLSSPNFLAGIRRHHYLSPSPDPGIGLGMMYPPTASVTTTTSGTVYSSSAAMSLPSSYATEQFVYANRNSNEDILSRSNFLARAGLDFSQELPPTSSSSIGANTLSRMDGMGQGGSLDQDFLMELQHEEPHSLGERATEIAATFRLNSNSLMSSQLKDDTNSIMPMWMMETRDNDLFHRSDLMLMHSRNGSHGLSGAAVHRQNVEPSNNDNMATLSITSTNQDCGDAGESKSTVSLSISQLIGGAMKIEPDDWMDYPESQ